VLQAVEQHPLTPDAIEAVVACTERDDQREQRTALRTEQQDVATWIAALTAAIEVGGEVASITARILFVHGYELQVCARRPAGVPSDAAPACGRAGQ
jgi:hypothetical protein